jgi:hypothetical protein
MSASSSLYWKSIIGRFLPVMEGKNRRFADPRQRPTRSLKLIHDCRGGSILIFDYHFTVGASLFDRARGKCFRMIRKILLDV